MKPERIRIQKKGKKFKNPIVYWMSRDQRLNDNWALIFAWNQANKYKVPLIVIFCLIPEFLEARPGNFLFMIKGLFKIHQDLHKLNIPFILLKGNPTLEIPKFIKEFKISQLIIDFSPLKIKRNWINRISDMVEIPIYEIDAHNIIPCWITSNKSEYSAYTFRIKVKKKLHNFLEEFPKLQPLKIQWKENFNGEYLKRLQDALNEFKEKSNFSSNFISGELNARKTFDLFITSKFKDYDKNRTDPTIDGQSNLSPYIHFGQISSQKIVMDLMKIKNIGVLKGNFYDEIIVRKELSDNFCWYNQNYDNFNGFPEWAKNSLDKHRNDKREYLYSFQDLEKGITHDDAWNAAQIQMLREGKMHGYMRMYWGKKILEWTESPEKALKYAQKLNDRYELDGRDPNGYTGIAWCIGGVHDRPWTERNIFGKIRYMNFEGLKRKYKIQDYIDQYIN